MRCHSERRAPLFQHRGSENHRKYSIDRPQLTVKRKLTDECRVFLRHYEARSGEQSKQDGEVIDRPLLSGVGWRKIYCDSTFGKLNPLFRRAARTLPGFTNCSVRKPDNIEGRQPLRQKTLNRHHISANSEDACRIDVAHHNAHLLVVDRIMESYANDTTIFYHY